MPFPTNAFSCLLFVAALTPPDCRLEDRERFPSRAEAYAGLQLAREHRRWHEQQFPLATWRLCEWRECGRDARWCFDCWDWLHAAQQGEGRGPDYWLYSLRRLRTLIGEEAYQAGRLPPPVPAWHFPSDPSPR